MNKDKERELLKKRVFELYKPPFTFNCGYIFDTDGQMMADETQAMRAHIQHVARIRGWGRLSYFEHPEALQDMCGEVVAEALTDYWTKHESNQGNK